MNRLWDEARDAPRIRHAFLSLAATARKWPAPAELWDHMPKLPEQLALPAKIVTPEAALDNIARIKAMLQPVHDFTPAPDPPEDRRPLAEVEAELGRHFAEVRDRKTQAAGGE